MKKKLEIQEALINIFKAGISKEKIKDVIIISHKEIQKILGGKKTLNFYIALHIKGDIYSIPYNTDIIDKDPIDTYISLKGGLTEYIRKTKKTQLIDQKRITELKEKGLLKQIGSPSHEWIGCPLIFKKKFYGVLAIQTYDPDIKYSNSDLKLIEFVSKSISMSIARLKNDKKISDYKKNLENEVSKKNRELVKTNSKLHKEILKVKKNEILQKILFNISELKNRLLSTKELINRIHKELSALIDVENFYVAIKSGKIKGKFLLPFMRDINPEESYISDKLYDIAHSFTDFVYTTQKPLFATRKKLQQIEQTSNYKMVGIKPKIWVGIPLKTKNKKILGVVTVQNYTDSKTYNKTDLRLLSLISTTIADALEFRQLEDHKKKLETRLIEAQKMETVGIFAAGISHEFNNLLSIIIGNAHIGLINSDLEDPFYKRFQKIIKSSESASDLIEKLMIFTNLRKKSKYLSYNIKDILNRIITEIKNNHSKAEFKTNIENKLSSTKVDKEDMEIVFSNILSNALDALKNTGIIDISISNTKINSAKYILISIKDNGHGIDNKIIGKIFDPFFTTKDPGKGTGLGLSMVYAIIKEYEGEIKINSEINKGTIVSIYLPAIKTAKRSKYGT